MYYPYPPGDPTFWKKIGKYTKGKTMLNIINFQLEDVYLHQLNK